MKKRTDRQRLIKELDTIFAKKVKERDGKCLRCHKTDNLQAAHIFSRSKKSVRWDMGNAVTLCSGCHIFYAHKFPLDFYDWIRFRMGDEAFNKLRLRSNLAVSLSVSDLQLLWRELQDT